MKLTNETIKQILSLSSFTVGSIIACICLFLIEPLGEISTTAISIVSEFLIMASGLIGADLYFDTKLKKFKINETKNDNE